MGWEGGQARLHTLIASFCFSYAARMETSHGALSGSAAFSISSVLAISMDMIIRLSVCCRRRVLWGAGGSLSNGKFVSIALPHTPCRAATTRLPTRPCFF